MSCSLKLLNEYTKQLDAYEVDRATGLVYFNANQDTANEGKFVKV